MENKGDPVNQQQQNDNQNQGNTSFVIRIPSYEEVVEGSQAKKTPQSLFNPSPSFSQAFNFIKNSEFYRNPPPPPLSEPSQSSEVSPSPSEIPLPRSRQTGPSEVPSTSASSAGGSRNSILVSHRQKGNPLLKHIRNVRWAFADVVCDYLLGQNACALYLSLRYHLLHPDYLYFRIRELQKNFKLRVVLCHVDVEDVVKPLLEITKTALLHDCTLLCAWSLEECGRYLETIKVYENKPADLIQGQMDMDYLSRLNHALTAVRHVNKTDVVTLGSTFGSLSNIMDASMEDLARCPGIGERKVKRLYDTFHEPFKRAVPNHGPIVETSTNNHAGPTSESDRNEVEKDISDASKRQKKETEISVKSALEAAFAKYSGAIGRRRNTPVQDETEEKIVAAQQDNNIGG
ncbi:Structure-specific endonuclease ERCC1-XPF, ERCC1 component [Handroanthus impetiginosus]|uniref:DNA excision repair protein ERCC-1 n=1 Tax=Handroanthus impetiginosus TaxID=429701 RepID=A0A2G9GGC3_9LAMI|nr:Structure-specific endonuclease ERCC1-XPF, ERCC1 component [Handroanthus impetiginosus]